MLKGGWEVQTKNLIDIMNTSVTHSDSKSDISYAFEIKQWNFYRKLMIKWIIDKLFKKEIIDYVIGFYITIIHDNSGGGVILSQSGFV